jgi:small-conductance mechanosensitive channel
MESSFISKFGGFVPDLVFKLPVLGEINFAPYVEAVIIFVALVVIFKIIIAGVVARLKSLSKKTKTGVDDVFVSAIESIRFWVYTIAAFFLALQPFSLPQTLDKIITAIFLLALVWQIIEIAVKFVDYFAMRVIERDEDGDGESDPNSLVASHMLSLFARIVLWVLGLLFVLSNLGIEVMSLVAGLGIGGIAIAFALQGILSDLFSSLSLYLDKPFRIGDFIVIGQDSGYVEKIGIKTTRIKTLQGEELVVSNSELTTARVQNFKKMKERRSTMQFGVTYETPQEKVEKIPAMVEKLFNEIPNARLDRVHFTTLGDSALLFDVVFYVDSPAYPDTLEAQQAFNFALIKACADEGIEFAYPTQTLYLNK